MKILSFKRRPGPFQRATSYKKLSKQMGIYANKKNIFGKEAGGVY